MKPFFFQSCLVSMKLPLKCIARESATQEAGKIGDPLSASFSDWVTKWRTIVQFDTLEYEKYFWESVKLHFLAGKYLNFSQMAAQISWHVEHKQKHGYS